MKKYWLFYEHRGYAEHETFNDRKKAVERYKELDNSFHYPVLVWGREIKIRKAER